MRAAICSAIDAYAGTPHARKPQAEQCSCWCQPPLRGTTTMPRLTVHGNYGALTVRWRRDPRAAGHDVARYSLRPIRLGRRPLQYWCAEGRVGAAPLPGGTDPIKRQNSSNRTARSESERNGFGDPSSTRSSTAHNRGSLPIMSRCTSAISLDSPDRAGSPAVALRVFGAATP